MKKIYTAVLIFTSIFLVSACHQNVVSQADLITASETTTTETITAAAKEATPLIDRISVTLGDTWTLYSKDAATIRYVTDDNSTIYITVDTSENCSNIDDFVEKVKVSYKDLFPDAIFQTSETLSDDSRSLKFELTHEDVRLRYLGGYFLNDGNVYTVLCGTTTEKFTQKAPEYREILKSVVIK